MTFYPALHVVHAPASFTAGTASDIHERLTLALGAGFRVVDIDCSETNYIDSGAIGAVLAAHRKFSAVGGELRWTGISDEVSALLELMRVDSLMFVRRRVPMTANL